ncbi:hypothetical protein ASPZODRAFT_128768 [Penicilliopsis zonata CBS 506.65]|uniref:Uncharacterized protein n=1 Tax=Penicilliopsis zonata CBS 506.65 TaxID=1073090 RepID=A0A1L9SSJ3_9EURO|nr:hypothetical protein ASPZODRAFT_128768 [Penicilliopsis zonata CBS 506.65]OJJ50149.1 hypothetical protein ASPZODRAFT_128768 [Penicilliopsis zonata CBS 506.65]
MSLQVNFSWRKDEVSISHEDQVIYTVSNHLKAPHLRFYKETKGGNKNDGMIGTSTFHLLSSSPEFTHHGRHGKLQSTSRWKMAYTHESYYLDSTHNHPTTMTWTSESGFKTWDFICLDERKQAVARFSANPWGIKKLGKIEFCIEDPLAREELILVGVTLYYCVLLCWT